MFPFRTPLLRDMLFADTDIDECRVNNGGCHTQATCRNTVGSFTCSCRPGYTGDGFTCSGIYTSLHRSDFAFLSEDEFIDKLHYLRKLFSYKMHACKAV